MRSFRFPSISKSNANVRYDDYNELASVEDVDYSARHDRREDLSRLKLMALTCCAGGLQVVLSLIMSNGTPFLITLGSSESLTAAVWVVAPLSGVFVQPYIGVLSDQCQSPLGRRRPFIIGGALGCVVCMLALGATKTVIHTFAIFFNADPYSVSRGLILASAILNLLGLYVFIQPLQAGVRALIVDSCPAHQQTLASAWASRLTGVGNIVGYLFGFMPVHQMIPKLDITQFAWLCIVASMLLLSTVSVTCFFVQEQDPRALPSAGGGKTSFVGTFRHILWSAKTMPDTIKQVCIVQFFAWMGWFPYLFYISSYVGDLYAAPLLARTRSPVLQAHIIEDAVRLGSLASLVFSIFALITNMLIPTLIADGATAKPSKTPHSLRCITMTRAWSLSHLLFAITLLTTLVPQTQVTATVIAAFIGISWAFTLWVPFALIGREVATRQQRNAKVLEGEVDMEPTRQDQAGAIMGLHNCAISAPQIFAALVCGTIFWGFPKIGIQDSIGWVLRFGSVGGFIASWLAARMED